ncbi:MAG TPA: hypothetical protein VJC14_00920 [Candidatus Paceibacterota bacterium]
MLEGKKPAESELQIRAEQAFRDRVENAMRMDPMSLSRPLKYKPGIYVLIDDKEGEEFKVKIKKGKAGIYMAELTDEKSGVTTPVVFNEQNVKMDIN